MFRHQSSFISDDPLLEDYRDYSSSFRLLKYLFLFRKPYFMKRLLGVTLLGLVTPFRPVQSLVSYRVFQLPPQRTLSSMKDPRDIDIPMDKIEFNYARSSGPGGQNVNKVNTKAELRFHVMTADWLPMDVRER